MPFLVALQTGQKETLKVKYSYTIELRPTYEEWNGFILDRKELVPTAKETWAGVSVVLDEVLSQYLAGIEQESELMRLRQQKCFDKLSGCGFWVRNTPDICRKSPGSMVRDCARTCNLCHLIAVPIAPERDIDRLLVWRPAGSSPRSRGCFHFLNNRATRIPSPYRFRAKSDFSYFCRISSMIRVLAAQQSVSSMLNGGETERIALNMHGEGPLVRMNPSVEDGPSSSTATSQPPSVNTSPATVTYKSSSIIRRKRVANDPMDPGSQSKRPTLPHLLNTPLKPILRRTLYGCGPPRRPIRFADDHGMPLVHIREIPAIDHSNSLQAREELRHLLNCERFDRSTFPDEISSSSDGGNWRMPLIVNAPNKKVPQGESEARLIEERRVQGTLSSLAFNAEVSLEDDSRLMDEACQAMFVRPKTIPLNSASAMKAAAAAAQSSIRSKSAILDLPLPGRPRPAPSTATVSPPPSQELPATSPPPPSVATSTTPAATPQLPDNLRSMLEKLKSSGLVGGGVVAKEPQPQVGGYVAHFAATAPQEHVYTATMDLPSSSWPSQQPLSQDLHHSQNSITILNNVDVHSMASAEDDYGVPGPSGGFASRRGSLAVCHYFRRPEGCQRMNCRFAHDESAAPTNFRERPPYKYPPRRPYGSLPFRGGSRFQRPGPGNGFATSRRKEEQSSPRSLESPPQQQ
ncbi:unnamed protein product [Caenorhabditis auriculariae]|uniref:C3H1-type domain-containing protein n=1 Tax=Caenorhabditis auriculariae TaxID=2777116 RepID=A0A8S1GTY1_9PELO|nr:unnamed protein product [Caenorhabditis auriculariae]